MPAMIVLPFEPLWMSARAGTLHAGRPRAGFHAARALDNSHTMTSLRGTREHPVVLIFGSYT